MAGTTGDGTNETRTRRFRRGLALALAVCLVPAALMALGRLAAMIGGCAAAAGSGPAPVVCARGGSLLAGIIEASAAAAALVLPGLAIAGAIAVFWALAEAARLMGRANAEREDRQ